MLGLQAANLEQQERLFKNQIRLGLREILQQELAFYNQAFNNISSCASILAGFAFTGMMLDPYDKKSDSQPHWVEDANKHTPKDFDVSRSVEILFNFACAATTCICLLTVVYSNYLGLFSTRLALRGGEMAVEESVMKIRGEYKVVLYSLTVSVECFIVTLPILAFYKMELVDSFLVTAVSLPAGVAVVFLYRRARNLFYLDKEDRFAAAKKKPSRGNDKKINFDANTGSSKSFSRNEGTGRLSEIVQDLDGRNDSFYHRPRKSTIMRRSMSWDATQSMGPEQAILEEEYGQTTSNPLSAIGKRWAFFKKSQTGGASRNPVRSSGNNL